MYILGPTARRFPLSPHFLSRWVSRLIRFPGLQPVLVSIAFPIRLPYLGVFPFTLHLLLNFIRVSSLRLTYRQSCSHSIDPSLADISRLGTGSGTRCCCPRGGARGRNLVSNL